MGKKRKSSFCRSKKQNSSASSAADIPRSVDSEELFNDNNDLIKELKESNQKLLAAEAKLALLEKIVPEACSFSNLCTQGKHKGGRFFWLKLVSLS
jgi:hypothetical protein